MGLLPGKVTRSWYARCIMALNDKWFNSTLHTFLIQKARCRRSILDVETINVLEPRTEIVGQSHVFISHHNISPQSVNILASQPCR
jgi:hypothetical protein